MARLTGAHNEARRAAKTIVIPAKKRRFLPGKTVTPPPFRFQRRPEPKPPALTEIDIGDGLRMETVRLPDPLPSLPARKRRPILTPLLAGTFATLLVVLGVRIQHLSKITRYTQYQSMMQSQPVHGGLEMPSLNAEAVVPQIKIEKGTAILDRVRQQAFAPDRKLPKKTP